MQKYGGVGKILGAVTAKVAVLERKKMVLVAVVLESEME